MADGMVARYDMVAIHLGEVVEEKLHRMPEVDEVLEIDSQAFIDVVLDVEGRTGLRFDGENYDFEQGIKLRLLAQAFV